MENDINTNLNKKRSSAAMKVFMIPELLEKVLLNLHYRNIFAATMVCKQFRDVIHSSERLSQGRFVAFNPSPDLDQREVVWPRIYRITNQLGYNIEMIGQKYKSGVGLESSEVFLHLGGHEETGDNLLIYGRRRSEESWRQINISATRAPVHLYIGYSAFPSIYEMWMQLPAPPATLGELWDTLAKKRLDVNGDLHDERLMRGFP